MKYTPAGGTIRIRELNSDMKTVGFSVGDSGPGIAVAERERVFERFYRIDKGRSRKLGGTGLGLSIVKNAVIFHGGTIRVYSQVGGGLAFDFSLKKKMEK